MKKGPIRETPGVLAVTDDQVLLGELRKSLTAYGRDLTAVPNAVLAYQRLLADRFRCMLLDLAVPQFHWDDLLLTMDIDRIETPAIVLAEGWQDTTMIRRFSNVVDCFPRRSKSPRIIESILTHLVCPQMDSTGRSRHSGESDP